jgi:hypothetical protein
VNGGWVAGVTDHASAELSCVVLTPAKDALVDELCAAEMSSCADLHGG